LPKDDAATGVAYLAPIRDKRIVDSYGVLIGLIGVVMGSLLTGYYTLRAQKQAAADQRRRDEETERRTVNGALRAVAAELSVLKADCFDPLDEKLKQVAQQTDPRRYR
jgi:hypothetical protein